MRSLRSLTRDDRGRWWEGGGHLEGTKATAEVPKSRGLIIPAPYHNNETPRLHCVPLGVTRALLERRRAQNPQIAKFFFTHIFPFILIVSPKSPCIIDENNSSNFLRLIFICFFSLSIRRAFLSYCF